MCLSTLKSSIPRSQVPSPRSPGSTEGRPGPRTTPPEATRRWQGERAAVEVEGFRDQSGGGGGEKGERRGQVLCERAFRGGRRRESDLDMIGKQDEVWGMLWAEKNNSSSGHLHPRSGKGITSKWGKKGIKMGKKSLNTGREQNCTNVSDTAAGSAKLPPRKRRRIETFQDRNSFKIGIFISRIFTERVHHHSNALAWRFMPQKQRC